MFEQYSDWVTLATVGVMALVFILCYWRLSQELLVVRKQLRRTQHDLKLINKSSVGLGRRVVDIESEIQRANNLAGSVPLASVNSMDDYRAREAAGEDLANALEQLEAVAEKPFPFEVHTNEHFEPEADTEFDYDFEGEPEMDADLEQTPYTIASDLLDQGVDLEEIEQRCGLSKAEVSLMATMHENMSKFSAI